MNENNIEKLIIEGIQDRKGRAITVVDMSHIEGAAASKFIICEGSSSMQVGAIADNVRESLLEKIRVKPYNYDGYANSEWIVVDYGDILVHVFRPETRQRYNLEDLWSDAVLTEIPDLD
ncbi:MAG: ribosome silencing factor [Bacteroidales bacterium]|nr:ribosome silencing factor [Bacteroidales bacterium]MBD5230456.1 ribosome silencing factor [Bacteroidales bacterium]MBD5247647.1 ribosome silencing factor [Barnesiella sp.]